MQNDIPEPMEVLDRQGQKAFRDRCAPYIHRLYEEMASNEWWVADNHTFDVITQGENGQLHRLYLTAFFDARSGIYTGSHVTTAPSSQSTLVALRKGILKYGIPENIYVDNGREFLTHDIGGLGHRKKKPKNGEERFEVPPVFERLGINMTNAIVKNAKAKIIERRFRDIKDHLNYMGKKVYFRYDPDDLSAVRVYDLEDRFIMTVPVDNTAVLTYGASKEEVKAAMGKVRRLERITKEALEASTVQAFGKRTALEP